MKRKFVQLAACGLAAALALSLTAALPRASAAREEQTIRVGYYYGTGALDGANLANETGSGFRLGYFNSANEFVQLASTADESISVVKTENVYYGTYNNYTSYHDAAVSNTVVGCYHLELPGSYATAQEAQLAVNNYEDGFVAWIQGAFYARVGNFTNRADAERRQAELNGTESGQTGGLDGLYAVGADNQTVALGDDAYLIDENGDIVPAGGSGGAKAAIVGTSAYGVSVVDTGTNRILFQYDDGGAGTGLGVAPNAAGDDGTDYETWFKGYTRKGCFRYQRLNGGDLTVVGVMGVEDYVKGVVPYEMSNSWPRETLKAGAVCARTYVLANLGRHKSYGFDLCSSSHCQVYYGTNRAGANSDAAVDETAGEVATYNGAYIDAVYYSSNGGASIDSSIPWGGNQSYYPYLVGVKDPYEALVADQISGYEWTRTYTGNQLRDVVRDAGYTSCSTVVSAEIAAYTDAGLPRQIRFTDADGKAYTISTTSLVKWFGLRSYNYWFGEEYKEPAESEPAESEEPVSNVHTADENGNLTISGRGWGHNVGLSQWGAYAQGLEGRTYKEILSFYYTGITVG